MLVGGEEVTFRVVLLEETNALPTGLLAIFNAAMDLVTEAL